MSTLTIKPTATKSYSAPTEPMSPIATKLDVESSVTASAGDYTPMVLPVADPHIVGAIWNDGGASKISAG